MMSSLRFIALSILAVSTIPFAHAGHQVVEAKQTVDVRGPFDRGSSEFQIGAGAYFSVNNSSRQRPELNTVDGAARLGWMLFDPSGTNFLRGNLELMVEVAGGGIVSGPGNVLTDVALLFRYNFVQPGAKFVPYIQLGGGGSYNDAYHDQEQRLLGQAFEFNLQSAIGVRYLFSDRCGAFLEGGWRHNSNAGLASRNLGLNQFGGLLGVSLFY